MKKPSFLSLAIASFALFMGLVTTARAQDAKAGDVVAGEKKVAMCIGCHNIPG
jgi:cytochrome c2